MQYSLDDIIDISQCQRKILYKQQYQNLWKPPEWHQRKLDIEKVILGKNITLYDPRDQIVAFLIKYYMAQNKWGINTIKRRHKNATIKHTCIVDGAVPIFLHVSNRPFRHYPILKTKLVFLKSKKGILLWCKTPTIRQTKTESKAAFLQRFFINTKIELQKIKVEPQEYIDLTNTCEIMISKIQNPTFEPNPHACCLIVEHCPFYKVCWGQDPAEKLYSSPKAKTMNKEQRKIYKQFQKGNNEN